MKTKSSRLEALEGAHRQSQRGRCFVRYDDPLGRHGEGWYEGGVLTDDEPGEYDETIIVGYSNSRVWEPELERE